MEVTRFVYEYTPYIMTIDMIVTNTDDQGHPMGYRVWQDVEFAHDNTRWVVDDEPTILIHPIVERHAMGRMRRVET